MNQLAVMAVLLPVTLCAAEFWESKPFQDWSDKDLQKVSGNSPWARQTRAILAPAGGPTRGTARPAVEDASSNDSGSGRGGDGPGAAGRLGSSPSDFDQGPQIAQPPGVPVVIRWQTALPLRQAQMRAKYGKEAASSPEAQKFLTQEPALYLLAISGLPGAIVSGGAGDQAKERITRSTTLTRKGKEPLRPIGIEFAPGGQAVDILIGFPRSTAITLDDQEVEFATQIGTASVKYKFKLRDMLVAGKLEL